MNHVFDTSINKLEKKHNENGNLDPSWANRTGHPMNGRTLAMLMANEIPYIRVPNFASPEECETVVNEAVKEGFSSYRGVEPRIDRIGNTVFEYNRISRDSYFAKNDVTSDIQKRIFSNSFDPVRRFMAFIHQSTGFRVRVATNASGRSYYAGLIRRIQEGTLVHVDFAPAEQQEWEVGMVLHQLSWNLYLRVSNSDEGKTHIYERQWRPEDEVHKEGSYGYNPRIVEGYNKATFEPRVGEVVIFNTRNYHYVDETRGERVAVASAAGLLPSDEIIFWS